MMKRFFTNCDQTASASFAEASFACAEMNSLLADTVLVSVFSILLGLIRILGTMIPAEPLQSAYA